MLSTYSALLVQLTSDGGRFALTEADVAGRRQRVFAAANETLSSLYRHFALYGDRDFLVEGERRFTYADTAARAARLAARLQAAYDVCPGDRVAIAMRNCCEWIIAFVAVSALGAIPALVNSRGTGEEMEFCVREAGASLVVADAARAAALAHAAVPVLTFLEENDPNSPSCAGHPLPVVDGDIDAVACILFTSGTTGRPKGAALTHRSILTGLLHNQLAGMITALQAGLTLEQLAAAPPPASLLAFPLFHVSGCEAVFLTTLLRGGKLVLAPRWHPAEAASLLAAEGVGAFSATPTMIWDLLNLPPEQAKNLTGLSSLATGGQAMPINLLRTMMERFPRAVFGTGYGLTETNGAVCMATGRDCTDRPHTAGRVLPLAEVKIVRDDGQEAATGSAGEIWVRGPMVMQGYWCRPTETARALTADGWFKTGDIGSLDADQFLTIVDRRTDMVIAGGENIYCAEVERILHLHPGVAEAAAFSVPDDRLGERLVASVVPHAGQTLSGQEIRDHVGRHLAAYKVPSEVRLAQGSLPRNAAGKIDKGALRAAAPPF